MLTVPDRFYGFWILSAAGMVAVMLLLAGCKSPRPPEQAAVGDLSGGWSARSVATTRPQPAGEIIWRLFLEEEDGGRIRGRGSLAHAGTAASFSIVGIRGERVIDFDLHLEDGERAKFGGGVMDVNTMVGEVELRGDTIPLAFTRG